MTKRWLLPCLSCLALACAVGRPDLQGASGGPPFDDAPVYAPTASGDDGSSGDDWDAPHSGPVSDAAEGSAETPETLTDEAVDDAFVTPDDRDATLDAGPEGACSVPPGPGDLIIDELMIQSVAGAGDYGEWLEIRNTLPCSVDLRGLHGECPDGAKVRTFDVTSDLWLPAQGTVVVADSPSRAIDHDVPGPVLVWAGRPGDVLRNQGATVSLLMRDTLIDAVTYPALKLSVGASIAFPFDCPPARRSDWTAWVSSNASWFPGFLGTPNAPNLDVHCP